MTKTILSIAILSITILIENTYAQVAARKDATLEDVHLQIEALTVKNDAESKELMALEALALIKSNNEKWVFLGAALLESLQRKEEAAEVHKLIAKKFPKGIQARLKEYNKIFDNKSTLTATEKEALYKKWGTIFPASLYDKTEQNIYLQADANMASIFFKEGNNQKAFYYVEKCQSNPIFPIYMNKVGIELMNDNKNEIALAILEPAFNMASLALKEKNESNVSNARAYFNLAPSYAKALLKLEKYDTAISILEELVKEENQKNPSSVSLLSQAYSSAERDMDAFMLLNDYLINQGNNEKFIKDISTLFKRLNNNNEGTLNDYLASLSRKSHNATLEKYKAEMIKIEAPNFSLMNLKGETISLLDLKGKVVILDFWATWCGPCKASFPGMQAAVEKYKDDKEVEFLFIDVWQKEDNYKELVQEFITNNKYTFNVLFDEMKDRSKSTAKAYAVRGIPTKFVIDKEGFIRFESSGGHPDIYKIVDEMSAKIELAKKG